MSITSWPTACFNSNGTASRASTGETSAVCSSIPSLACWIRKMQPGTFFRIWIRLPLLICRRREILGGSAMRVVMRWQLCNWACSTSHSHRRRCATRLRFCISTCTPKTRKWLGSRKCWRKRGWRTKPCSNLMTCWTSRQCNLKFLFTRQGRICLKKWGADLMLNLQPAIQCRPAETCLKNRDCCREARQFS